MRFWIGLAVVGGSLYVASMALRNQGVCISQMRVIPDEELVELMIAKEGGGQVCIDRSMVEGRRARSCGHGDEFPDIPSVREQCRAKPAWCTASTVADFRPEAIFRIDPWRTAFGSEWRFVRVGYQITTIVQRTGDRILGGIGRYYVVDQCGNGIELNNYLAIYRIGFGR